MRTVFVTLLIIAGALNYAYGRSWFNDCVTHYPHYTDYKSIATADMLKDKGFSFIIYEDDSISEPVYVEYIYELGADRWEMEFHKIDKSSGLPESFEAWLSSDYVVPSAVAQYSHFVRYFNSWIINRKNEIYADKLYKKIECEAYNYKYEFVDLSVLFLPKNFNERYPPVTPKRTNY